MPSKREQERLTREVKVFVSFATPDHQFVRRLLARLAALGLDVWDYSDEEHELKVGSPLRLSLIKRIDMADVCIPVVSPHAFVSWACQEEVRHALSRWTANRLRLFPLVSALLSAPSRWPDPYSAIPSEMLYQRIDFHSERELEGALIRLCDDLEWLYRPPIIGDPRLPFMQKFKDELKQVATGRPGREGRGNAIYRRLMTTQQDFEEYVKSGDYIRALERINLILLTCEYEFPETWLYYPYITKAVCQIALGRVRQALMTIKPLFRHPSKDENLYGILGDIRDREGDHQAALRSYETALQYDPDDTDLCAHVLLQRIHLGKPVMEHEFLSIHDSADRTMQDRRRLKAVQAIVLVYTKRLEEAKKVFLELLLEADPEDIEMGHVIQCVECLHRMGSRGWGRSY